MLPYKPKSKKVFAKGSSRQKRYEQNRTLLCKTPEALSVMPHYLICLLRPGSHCTSSGSTSVFSPTPPFLAIKRFFKNVLLKEGFVKCKLRANVMLLVTRPLPRDGGVAEDHGAPEAGQLSRVWTRDHKETESRQRVSGAKSP